MDIGQGWWEFYMIVKRQPNRVELFMIQCREAIARSVTQFILYPLECWKTNFQMKGNIKQIPFAFNGMVTSCLTTGISYGSYFAIYNSWNQSWKDHPFQVLTPVMASGGSFLIRMPLGNAMRNIQVGMYPNLGIALLGMYQTRGFTGLYQGGMIHLIEDVIEMELKLAAYRTLSQWIFPERPISPIESTFIGGLAGSWAAFWTTPTDVIKTHLAVQKSKMNLFDACTELVCRNGPLVFTRGWNIRSSQQALKTALYFGVLEMLPT
jgi:hypothetical protein